MATKNKGMDREAALFRIIGRDIESVAEPEDKVEAAGKVEQESAPQTLTAATHKKKPGKKSKMPASEFEFPEKARRCFYLSPDIIEALRQRCYEDPKFNASGHVEAALTAYLGLDRKK